MAQRPPQPSPRWATKPQVAEHLQVSTRTVDRMVASGEIVARRVHDRLVRFDLNEIDTSLTPVRTIAIAGGAG